jgi:hypothetical protein
VRAQTVPSTAAVISCLARGDVVSGHRASARRAAKHAPGKLPEASATVRNLLVVLDGVPGREHPFSRNARVRNRHADPLLPCAISWLGALSTAQKLALLGGVLALSLLAGQWWFLVHLLRQNGRLLVRLEATLAEGGSVVAPSANGTPVDQAEGLPVGSAALEFSLSGVHGETITLEALRSSGKPVMLLFTDPGCSPCNAMS